MWLISQLYLCRKPKVIEVIDDDDQEVVVIDDDADGAEAVKPNTAAEPTAEPTDKQPAKPKVKQAK